MKFKRNEYFDNLIVKVKRDENVLKQLDYEQLALFINYLEDLNKYIKYKKGD